MAIGGTRAWVPDLLFSDGTSHLAAGFEIQVLKCDRAGKVRRPGFTTISFLFNSLGVFDLISIIHQIFSVFIGKDIVYKDQSFQVG